MVGSVILALTMVHRPEEAKNIDVYICFSSTDINAKNG
jgi:hypothetical protein